MPIQKDEKLKALVSEEALKGIFSNLAVITGYHKVFLENLKKRMQSWDPSQTKLGDIFLVMSNFLKAYLTYVNNYDNTMDAIDSVRAQNKELDDWLTACADLPQCDNLELRDFLITPIQRCPRYVMLLDDLTKNTWEGHPDYSTLIEAKKKIAEVATFLNEQKRKNEQRRDVSRVYTSIIGLETEFLLVSASRKFIREGPLVEIDGKGEKHTCYCYLFNDLMIWTRVKKNLNHFKRVDYLNMILVTQDIYKSRQAIAITSKSSNYIAYSPLSDEDTLDWYNQIISYRSGELLKVNDTKINKRKTFLFANGDGEHTERRKPVSKREERKSDIGSRGSFIDGVSEDQSGKKNSLRLFGRNRSSSASKNLTLTSSSEENPTTIPDPTIYRIGVLGDSKSRKEWISLLFPEEIEDNKTYIKVIQFNNENIGIELKAIDGMKEGELGPWGEAYMLTYNSGSEESFQEVSSICSQLERLKKFIPRSLLAIGDMEERKISRERGQELAAKLLGNCPYLENGYNTVEEAIFVTVNEIRNPSKDPLSKRTFGRSFFANLGFKQEAPKSKDDSDKKSGDKPPTVKRRNTLTRLTRRSKLPVFGVSLEELLEREANSYGIPDCVHHCFDYLLERGIMVEEIFRASGSQIKITELRQRFDKGDKVNFYDEKVDPHTVAGLLRSYFRELPKPLFPSEFYDDLLYTEKQRGRLSEVEYHKRLVGILKKFPISNLRLIKTLLHFLKVFSTMSHVNKMDTAKLSMVFSQSTIYPSEDEPSAMVQDAAHVNSLFQTLIDNHDKLVQLPST